MLNLGPDIEKLSADVFKSYMLTFLEHYYSKRGLKEKTPCGNFMIFLSLRCYVKSILANLEVQNPLFCYFVNYLTLKSAKIHKNLNSGSV